MGVVKRTLLRLLGGSILIVLLATAASATTFFEDVGIISDAIGHGVLIKPAFLAPTYAGQPVTILILGSDTRALSHIAVDRLDPRHSDTILLAHLDPQSGQTTLMSIRATCRSATTPTAASTRTSRSIPPSPTAARPRRCRSSSTCSGSRSTT